MSAADLPPALCYAAAMGVDTKWIVGTGIGIVAAVLTTGIGLAALMVSLSAGVNARFDEVNVRFEEVRGELQEMKARMDSFDTRLRNLEVAFGRVDQRLLIIERYVLPTPEPPAE